MSWDSPGWKETNREYHAERIKVEFRKPSVVVNNAPKPSTSNISPDIASKSKSLIEKMSLGFPDMTETGKIRNTCNNARHAIKLMGVTCEYDEFHDKLIIGGQTIGQYAGELSDHACLVLRRMIEEEYEFDPGREKNLRCLCAALFGEAFRPDR